jgi:SnoaL-like protein
MTGSPTEVFTGMLHGVDTLDWAAVRACFTDRIDADYTSLWGGEAATVAVDDVIADWTELATGFDATQHLTGPYVVTSANDHTVTCATTVRAYHHVVEDGGASTWMVSGRYDIRLERENRHPGGGDPHDADSLVTDRVPWRIAAITLHLGYEDGDRGLVDLARKRSRAGVGGRTG